MLYQSGLLLSIILAGAFSGTALLPMKFTKEWRFENTWLIYAICAYLLSPWLVAVLSIPHLFDVYAGAGFRPCVLTAIFGFGWGLAVVLNGLGVAMIGLSLASAIMMGSSIALGSLFPLLLKDSGQITTGPGIAILGLGVVMLVGVLLCARAGQLRGGDAKGERRSVTTRGILICLIAGTLSTLFNVALAYGDVISRQAIAHGAQPASSANAIWSLAVSAGSLPSILLCTTSLTRTRTWSLFNSNFNRNASLCVVMAVLWITGTVIYGAAAGMLGKFGAAVSWPIYMSGIILTSNVLGWITGEWRGVTGAPVRYLLSGVGVQIVSIVALGRIQ